MGAKHDEDVTLRAVQLGKCRDPLNTSCNCLAEVPIPSDKPTRKWARAPYHQRALLTQESERF